MIRLAIAFMLGVAALGPNQATGTRPQAASQENPAATLEDVQRLRAYHERLVALVKTLPRGVSLVDLLRPVLLLAETRAATGSPPAENRAALIAVCFYVNNWPLEALAPEARTWERAGRIGSVLSSRGDLAQHFIVSAVIAAAAGSPLADAAGLYKELDDARRGSGFSFSDLAADRAGTLFGLYAARSTESALRFHTRLSPNLSEADIMPSIDGLPDGLSEAEFTRRFGGLGTPAYKQLVSEIDRRVAALPFFQ